MKKNFFVNFLSITGYQFALQDGEFVVESKFYNYIIYIGLQDFEPKCC